MIVNTIFILFLAWVVISHFICLFGNYELQSILPVRAYRSVLGVVLTFLLLLAFITVSSVIMVISKVKEPVINTIKVLSGFTFTWLGWVVIYSVLNLLILFSFL